MESDKVLAPDSQANREPPSHRLVDVTTRRIAERTLATHVLTLASTKETIPELQFEILPQSQWPSVAEFLLANFFPAVPIAKIAGVDVGTEVRPWLGKFVHSALAYPISIGVRNERGQLVAVCFNVIETATQRLEGRRLPNMNDYLSPDEQPAMCMNMAFVDTLADCPAVSLDVAFNVFMLSVSPLYCRMGLARALIRLSIRLSDQLGIDYVVAQAVNHYAAKAFETCGFVCVKQLYFDEFVYDGQTPLANCGVHQAGKLMLLHLPFYVKSFPRDVRICNN